MPNCKYIDCKHKISKIIGHCKQCDAYFCAQHRLPEAHNCIKLVEFRLSEKQILMQKLYDNSVTKNKLTKI